MPCSTIVDCGSRDAYCLASFLRYLGFETRSEGSCDVLVVLGDCDDQSCKEAIELRGTARVIVADHSAARTCEGLGLLDLAQSLEGPVSIRVDKERGRLVYSGQALFLVFKEVERLLGWKGLLWYTPPLSRERVEKLVSRD
jgi:hypothetical protein